LVPLRAALVAGALAVLAATGATAAVMTAVGRGADGDDPGDGGTMVEAGGPMSRTEPAAAATGVPEDAGDATSTSGDATRAPVSTEVPGGTVAEGGTVVSGGGSGQDQAMPAAQPEDCPAATVTVRSSEELSAALAAAGPGDSILIADGTYEGKFVARGSGTAEAPVFLCGSRGAVLDGGGIKAGYVLHLDHVSHWRLSGFTVRNGQKGVMADGTSRSVISGLLVEQIGDEGIHLRAHSTANTVLRNTVRHTGLRREKFGEGVYVGSAQSNWSQITNGEPDRSDGNLIEANTISDTTSESIDIKEGTTGGRIVGNMLDGMGTTDADSLIDVKGNDWIIEGNVLTNAPEEGVQTHRILEGWGARNTFRANTVDVVGDGNHFYIHDAEITDNRVDCDNRTGGGDPVRSNVDCVG
jgi:hypothetical protein